MNIERYKQRFKYLAVLSGVMLLMKSPGAYAEAPAPGGEADPGKDTAGGVTQLHASQSDDRELEKDTRRFRYWLEYVERRLKKRCEKENLSPSKPLTCAFGLDWNYRGTEPIVLETSGSPDIDQAARSVIENTYFWPLTNAKVKQRFFLVKFENDSKNPNNPIVVSLIEPNTPLYDSLIQKAEFKRLPRPHF